MTVVKCEICGLRTNRVKDKKRSFMARFPLDEDRCKQWVKITGNEDLAYVPIEKLHQLKYICGKHFRPKDFKKKKTQLRRKAVPCIGLTAEPLSDEILSDFPLHLHKKAVEDQPLKVDATNPSILQCSKDFSACKVQDHDYCKDNDKGVPLHRFPNPKTSGKKFITWILNIGGEIALMDHQDTYDNRRVCHRHFADVHKYPTGRLSKLAIPTMHIPGARSIHKNNNNGQAKRLVLHSSECESVVRTADDATALDAMETAGTAGARGALAAACDSPARECDDVEYAEEVQYISATNAEDVSELDKLALRVTLTRIEANPQLYIGIPKNCYHLVQLLREETGVPTVHILMCLKKVKLDTHFEELADQFGITASQAEHIFLTNIPLIANTLRSFIVSLDSKVVNNQSIPFRNKRHTTCIVTSLKLNVQPIKKAGKGKRASIKKRSQTATKMSVKYLISTAPDGVINYVSPGYTGISDETLLKDTNYLDKLKPGSHVAMRGFRNADQVLANRGLRLLNLETQGSGLIRGKVRNRLEDNIERVLQRVNEFTMMKDQSVISADLVKVVDDAIVISCALSNLQSVLIN